MPRITGDVEPAGLATKAFRKLRKQANEITAESDDAALHEVRKTAKKARYAAELAEPVAGKRAARFVKQAKAFQDVVGEHQDAVVAEERLRELAAAKRLLAPRRGPAHRAGTDAPRRSEDRVSKGVAPAREGRQSRLVMKAVLVRHARAGHRDEWTGDDSLRPLDKRGRRQAAGLAAPLTALGVDRLVSSPSVRCVETFEPAAASMGLELEQREELAEGASPDEVRSLLADLDGATPALCTHGDVVEALLGERLSLKKGAARVLELLDGELRLGEEIPPPRSRTARAGQWPTPPASAASRRCRTTSLLLEELEHGALAEARPRDDERHREPALNRGEKDGARRERPRPAPVDPVLLRKARARSAWPHGGPRSRARQGRAQDRRACEAPAPSAGCESGLRHRRNDPLELPLGLVGRPGDGVLARRSSGRKRSVSRTQPGRPTATTPARLAPFRPRSRGAAAHVADRDRLGQSSAQLATAPRYARRPSSSAETTRAGAPAARASRCTSSSAFALWRPGAVTMTSTRAAPSSRATRP